MNDSDFILAVNHPISTMNVLDFISVIHRWAAKIYKTEIKFEQSIAKMDGPNGDNMSVVPEKTGLVLKLPLFSFFPFGITIFSFWEYNIGLG